MNPPATIDLRALPLDELSLAERTLLLTREEREELLASYPDEAVEALPYDWTFWRRPDQTPPEGEDWRLWVLMEGRGAGKTRAGSECVRERFVPRGPAGGEGVFIGATAADARDLMVEGPSGILAVSPPGERPDYEPSKRLLTWPNGAVAHLRSAEDPEGLRGLSLGWAWCIPGGEQVETVDGPRPIEDVAVGDLVWTRDGLRPVTAAGPTRIVTDLVRITVADGRHLDLTPEHKVMADGRWTPAAAVGPGAIIAAWSDPSPDPPPGTTGEASGGTATRAATTKTAPANSSIGSLPESSTLPLTYTTATRTEPITTRRTWCPSPERSTTDGTSGPDGQRGMRSAVVTAPSSYGRSGSPARWSVWPAERPTSPPGCGPSSARGRVERPMAVVVVERRSCPPTQTYDLKVEGSAEFFAGGMLVHNCDELAKWRYLTETWENLRFAMREGPNPQTIVTTTPKPRPLIRSILSGKYRGTVLAPRVSTYRNAVNLARSFLEEMVTTHEGTRRGRQELHAELLEDVEGALWTLAMIEADRLVGTIADGTWTPPALPILRRKVVGVDPSGTKGGAECGIIVAGVDARRPAHAYVLDDLSVRGSPGTWGRAAVRAYFDHGADALVAEVNFGAEMVEHVIRTVSEGDGYPSGEQVRFHSVRASRGKQARAEPIVGLYEQHRVHHVGSFSDLEAQMTTWVPGETDQDSPDRVDAVVWALTDLLIGHRLGTAKTTGAQVAAARL